MTSSLFKKTLLFLGFILFIWAIAFLLSGLVDSMIQQLKNPPLDTTNWKTYTNTNDGYRFKYPELFTLSPSGSAKAPTVSMRGHNISEVFTVSQITRRDDSEYPVRYIPITKFTPDAIRQGARVESDKLEELRLTTINGTQAYEQVEHKCNFMCENYFDTFYIQKSPGSPVLRIDTSNFRYQPGNRNYAKAILSTFEFINP